MLFIFIACKVVSFVHVLSIVCNFNQRHNKTLLVKKLSIVKNCLALLLNCLQWNPSTLGIHLASRILRCLFYGVVSTLFYVAWTIGGVLIKGDVIITHVRMRSKG